MKKILLILILVSSLFGETKVAVFGGLWPMPSLLGFFTDAKIIYMPKASVNAIQYSLVHALKPELLQVPFGQNENIEELLRLDADIYYCHVQDFKLYELLKKSGKNVRTFKVNVENNNLKLALKSWLDTLALDFNIADKSRSLLAAITQQEEYIAQKTKDERKVRAMILRSLNNGQIVAGGRGYLIHNSGGINLFESESDRTISIEEVYSKNPEIIFITNFTPTTPNDLLESKEWNSIDAVKNKRVYKLPLATYRPYAPNLDIAPILLFMAQKNYPHIFTDTQVREAFKKQFSDFYAIDLEESQVDLILNPQAQAGITK